jgi:two-component system phosphate regulon response regulator PhoB
MEKILVVEDEVDIADLIRFNLTRKGYEVITAHDGIAGTDLAISESPHLVILDLMLPGKDGYSVLKDMRRDSRTADTPVLMLTARAQTEDRIKGLESGADDYLTKPFSPKELVLRVQAILKRRETRPGTVVFTHGDLTFDKNNFKFHIKNERVDLTTTEFKLLLFLCERAGATQDRNELLRSIWEYSDAAHTRTLDTHMKRLRRKLGEHASMVETVRGVGYRISELK